MAPMGTLPSFKDFIKMVWGHHGDDMINFKGLNNVCCWLTECHAGEGRCPGQQGRGLWRGGVGPSHQGVQRKVFDRLDARTRPGPQSRTAS